MTTLTQRLREQREGTHCTVCHAAFVAEGCGTGYAIRPTDERICYSCADAEQVAEVLADDRSPVFAYYSRVPLAIGLAATFEVTTWTGGKLPLTITRWLLHGRWTEHGRNRYATGNARDSRGRMWSFYAAVDNGSYLKLRPTKGA